jgi:hypothetical protein
VGSRSARPLWGCTQCGREFANRNQSHACGRHDLESHFRGKAPEGRALFDAVLKVVKACGPVKVLPEKTRIAFSDIDAELDAWLREAYAVGEQRHLRAAGVVRRAARFVK